VWKHFSLRRNAVVNLEAISSRPTRPGTRGTPVLGERARGLVNIWLSPCTLQKFASSSPSGYTNATFNLSPANTRDYQVRHDLHDNDDATLRRLAITGFFAKDTENGLATSS
jgi:hypothetical protein